MKAYRLFSWLLAATAWLAADAADATKEAAAVRRIIERVNDTWQAAHAPEASAFWDEAAYHTGNMEAYRLTGNTRWMKKSPHRVSDAGTAVSAGGRVYFTTSLKVWRTESQNCPRHWSAISICLCGSRC